MALVSHAENITYGVCVYIYVYFLHTRTTLTFTHNQKLKNYSLHYGYLSRHIHDKCLTPATDKTDMINTEPKSLAEKSKPSIPSFTHERRKRANHIL